MDWTIFVDMSIKANQSLLLKPWWMLSSRVVVDNVKFILAPSCMHPGVAIPLDNGNPFDPESLEEFIIMPS